MSRVTDEQIAEWRTWGTRGAVLDVLDALEAERLRADQAEARIRDQTATSRFALGVSTVAEALWKSRRVYQQGERAVRHNERQLQKELTRICLEAMTADTQAQENWERLQVLEGVVGKAERWLTDVYADGANYRDLRQLRRILDQAERGEG